MIYQIWGIKLKTFLFLTKINFFTNFLLFIYLNLNTLLNFDKRPEIIFTKNTKDTKDTKNSNKNFVHIQYTQNEMSLIRAGFSFSVIVNFLYWSILFFKPDFMGNSDTPMHVELFLHGGNSLVILIEGFLNKKSLHENVKFGSLGVLSFAFGYITVKYVVYYLYDLQIYPMISKLSVFKYYCLAFIAYFMYLFSISFFRRFVMENGNDCHYYLEIINDGNSKIGKVVCENDNENENMNKNKNKIQ